MKKHEEYFCPLKRNQVAEATTTGTGQMKNCYCSHLQPEPDTSKDRGRCCKRKHFVNGSIMYKYKMWLLCSYSVTKKWMLAVSGRNSLRLDHKRAITTKESLRRSKQLPLLRRMVACHVQHQSDHNSFTSAPNTWYLIALKKGKGRFFHAFLYLVSDRSHPARVPIYFK